MKNKTAIFFTILIVAVIALLVWARAANGPRQSALAATWPGTDVNCLLFGHQNLSQHIHPALSITVDGTPETIPANIGITSSCMAEIHTHDATGEIHIESLTAGRTFTILDFLKVWGKSIDRQGYTYQMYVNGQIADPNTYTFKDQDKVELQYTSAGKTPTPPPDAAPDANFNLKL